MNRLPAGSRVQIAYERWPKRVIPSWPSTCPGGPAKTALGLRSSASASRTASSLRHLAPDGS